MFKKQPKDCKPLCKCQEISCVVIYSLCVIYEACLSIVTLSVNHSSMQDPGHCASLLLIQFQCDPLKNSTKAQVCDGSKRIRQNEQGKVYYNPPGVMSLRVNTMKEQQIQIHSVVQDYTTTPLRTDACCEKTSSLLCKGHCLKGRQLTRYLYHV